MGCFGAARPSASDLKLSATTTLPLFLRDNSNAAPVAGGDITVTMDQPALSKWVGEWTDKCFTGGKDKSFNAFQCTITSPEMVISVFNGVLPS